MRLGFSLILLLCGLWALWSGHYTPLFLSLGAASCMFVVVLSVRMDIVDPDALPAHIGHKILTYLPWLAWEIVKANVEVMRLILSPKLDISPTLIEVEAIQKSDLGQTIYVNSITMTPGTVSIDLADGKVLVHAITHEMAQGLVDSDMDKRAAVLEGQQS